MVRNLTLTGATLVALLTGAIPITGCDGVNPIGGGGWMPNNAPNLVSIDMQGTLHTEDASNAGIHSSFFTDPFLDELVYGGVRSGTQIEFGDADVPGQTESGSFVNQEIYDNFLKGTWYRIDGFRITSDNPELGGLTDANLGNGEGCPSIADMYNDLIVAFDLVAYFPGDDVVERNNSEDKPYLGFPTDEPITDIQEKRVEIKTPLFNFVCDTYGECVEERCTYSGPEAVRFDFSPYF